MIGVAVSSIYMNWLIVPMQSENEKLGLSWSILNRMSLASMFDRFFWTTDKKRGSSRTISRSVSPAPSF